MDVIKEIRAHEWVGQGLNAVPLIFEAATSSVYSLRPTLKDGYTLFYCTYKKTYCTGYYLKEDIERLGKAFWDRFLDPAYRKWFREEYLRQYEKAAGVHKVIDSTDLSSLSDEELLSIAVRANRCIREGLGIGHMIEPFSMRAEQVLKEELFRLMPRQANRIMGALLAPSEKPFILEYESLVAKGKIEEARKRFSWIRNSYAGRFPLEETLTAGETNAPPLEKPEVPPTLQPLVEAIGELSTLQDIRKKNSLIAIDYFCRVAPALAKRHGIPVEELYFFMPHELDDDHLKNGIFLEEVRKRMTGFSLLNVDGKITTTFESPEDGKTEERPEIITGIPTSVGTAIGRVKICMNISQVGKIEDGDVLVTSMTRPEYLPAMKKAAAIVTDEGGVTSHAAVLARELGKPCIIATRNATKVLRDNDLVEVKAGHGTVRILGQAESS